MFEQAELQGTQMGSLRNKRPDLSGRPPCKGVAIGVARDLMVRLMQTERLKSPQKSLIVENQAFGVILAIWAITAILVIFLARVPQMKLAKIDDAERVIKVASQISKRFISKL